MVLGWMPEEWAMKPYEVNVPIQADSSSEFKMMCTEEGGMSINCCSMVDADVASRWGPSRLPPAKRWSRDVRSAKLRDAATEVQVGAAASSAVR